MLIAIPWLYRCDSVVRSSSADSLQRNDNTAGHLDSAAANRNHSNSNTGSSIVSTGQRTTLSPEAENAPLFPSRARTESNMRISECESVV